MKTGKPVIFNCHVGLTNFVVPIMIEDKYMSSIVGGQVLIEPPDENYFRQVAKVLGLNEEEYISEVKNINIASAEKVQAITKLLYVLTNSIAAVAYVNFQLTDLGLDYKIPRNIVLEEWFFNDYSSFKRSISSREFEVLKLIVLGKSNTEIAGELFISVHTVKAHVSSILEKFSVDDRVQLAVKVVREGIV